MKLRVYIIRKIHFNIFLILILVLLFRIYFGLNLDFWNDDERHVYLLGLNWYTSGTWPFYGPDVIHTRTMIPGALQGVLIGLPLFIFPIPESPIYFINILSFLTLCFFTHYCVRLIYKIYGQKNAISIIKGNFSNLWLKDIEEKTPFLFIFLWITTLPWTLEFGTHVYNPSYLLPFELIFFVSFFEQTKILSTGLLKKSISTILMGLSLGCMIQLHLSWPILAPLILLALYNNRKSDYFSQKKWCGYFLLGFFIPSLLLLPTLIKFGLTNSMASATTNILINWKNLSYIVNNFIRIVTFSTHEILLFLGGHEWPREKLIFENPLIIPFAIYLVIFSIIHSVSLVVELIKLFFKGNEYEQFLTKLLLFLCLSSTMTFLLSSRDPVSRNFYLLFPISIVFSIIWLFNQIKKYPKFIKYFYGAILCSLVYHSILSFGRKNVEGLYKDRNRILTAIKSKDSSIFETFRYPDIFKQKNSTKKNSVSLKTQE